MHMYRAVFGFVLLRCLLGAETQIPPIPSAAAPVYSLLADCPLNATELSNHEWIIQRCQQDAQNCCQSLMYLARIILFKWLHRTGSFLLPDNHTAVVCLDAIQQQLHLLGMGQTTFEGCKLRPEDFVSGPDQCNHITNLSEFEKAVVTSTMQKYCEVSSRQGRFECEDCISAMNTALSRLQKGGGGNRGCKTFVISYVGGGINSYDDVGPDAAPCLLISQDLLNSSDNTSNGHHRSQRRKAARIAVCILIPALAIVVLFGIYAFRKGPEFGGMVGGSNRRKCLRREGQDPRENVDVSRGVASFSFSEIKEFTESFSALNVVGEGGSGIVYRGVLPDGSQIAVKKFKHSSTTAEDVFRNEVKVISNVKHRNLLPLKGYCIWGGESNRGRAPQQRERQYFLVYDFMPNGSLAEYLFGGNKPCLSWPERHKIAVGIARGLAYLHEDAKPSIIHRDVKAANVLLDADLNPLVADFGLAKFKPEGYSKTHYTTRAVGTMGYVAPEYALYGRLTDKSDVFGFGILLLELISGRRALDSSFGHPEGMNISDWASHLMYIGRLEEVIDGRIAEDSVANEMMQRGILLALQCAHQKVARRPSIQQTLVALECIHRPLLDMILLSNIRLCIGSESHHGEASNWDPCEHMERKIFHEGGTHGNVSLDSYRDGR